MGWDDSPEYGSPGTWRSYVVPVIVVILVALGMFACAGRAHAEPHELVGVATVIDGDTIEIHGQRVRLSGIDAPERGRRCGATNVYQRASLALADIVADRTVRCAITGENHERLVGVCRAGGADIGAALTEEGWARDWPRYSHGAYADEEAAARRARRGLWGLSCPADLWGNRNYSRR